jgi:hypothetical protein
MEDAMRTFVVVAALAVAACTPPAEQSADQPAGQSTDAVGPTKSADQPAGQSTDAVAPNNCNATAPSTWPAGSETITIEGSSVGADCASAEATITLRRADGGGGAMYSQVFAANQIRVLAGANTVADMERRLQEWVSPSAALDSTGDLPEWTANAAIPGESESPFRPYGGMDRAAYAALRAADAPMFCFVQGMESQACFWLDAGALRRIGEKQIPG